MSLQKLSQRDGKWVVDGQVKEFWAGRDSFKLANMLSKYFAGHDGQKWLVMAERWVEWNQLLLGENVILRVFGETGGWEGHPMFGAEPADAGIWDLEDLRKRSAEGRRIKELTGLNKKVIEWLMKTSHESGVAFEYVVDATLKHTEGDGSEGNQWLHTPITDHAIRQTCEYMRELWLQKYPKVKIVIEARNEAWAHNKMRTKLNEVNRWAERFYRWEREVDGDKEIKLAFASPGSDWVCRQWPEGYIVVDRSVGNGVHVGTEPGRHKMGLRHPDREPKDRKWWELPTDMEQDRADCRGTPLGYNESMPYVDEEDYARAREWYGSDITSDLSRYLEWMENCRQAVEYFIIHDEKGMQCDVDWPRKETRLEAELRGLSPPPPPPPPPGSIDFRPVISRAYRDLLGRPRNRDGTYGDRKGLDYKNEKMQDKMTADGNIERGMTEAEMREKMIRSVEYRKQHPG